MILTKEALDIALLSYPKISEQIAKIAERRYAAHKKKLKMAFKEEFREQISLVVDVQDLKKVA